ncbi:RNA polymerase sigma factor [Gilliamella apicola]|uniref:RNA polymerase subunit sigma-70 n=3 Tax=Gilliamella apicola TaxID=1196095 RepID=A0A242NDE8_9GAMM|nr:RNA polymerase sigma factor [Gilliamella apicola]OTP81292.1 RNA polymerase subunit sigma-70 [Gilliamella apicola]OTP82728.1 RNA polymerase subunit sigma-70 [Gilliamella apicola]OTP97717.1 RNA polymerase subunit sigma-70 [Gilliamella apicola]OTQ08652.1 RNA polymerase subunit sigma-70 [Gilliamella apicola]OTQ14446.1 RNA polymerase subunit sigma-70 [Gilliamella apicola]
MSKNREQLIKLACQGDQKALEKLLLICQPDIKRFARRTCSTSEDVEDAVQIVLWQLYRKIGMLKTVATFTGWLFRIVERECYRLFKIRRSKNINSDFELDNLPTTNLDMDLKIDLINAIIVLPLIYREVLILKDVQEYSSPEVAAKLGITVQAVKSRLHRARTIIKEQINSQKISNI